MENRYLTVKNQPDDPKSVYVTRRAHNLSLIAMGIFTLICMLCAIYSSDAAIDTAEKRLSFQNREAYDEAAVKANEAAVKSEALLFEPLYIAREYDGTVGVFDYKSGELLRKIDVRLTELPDADREWLSDGVKVYSAGELYELEDSLTS